MAARRAGAQLANLVEGVLPNQLRTGLSYGDVLITPRLSPIRSRKDVSLSTRLTARLTLKNPIISSNMDTVTEARMAIAMARNGGIGIFHRFMALEDQVQ